MIVIKGIFKAFFMLLSKALSVALPERRSVPALTLLIYFLSVEENERP